MISVKRKMLGLLIPSLMLCACQPPRVATLVVNVLKSDNPVFYNIKLDATNKEMNDAGFEYGDLINVKIEKDGEIKKQYDLAYVTNFNEVGSFNKCLCDYEAKGEKLNISPGLDNKGFDATCFEGGTCTITMKQKAGFKKIRDITDITTKLTYEECGRNNSRYANFRDVVQLGTISKNVQCRKLYRGSSPFNMSANPDRYDVADQMLSYYSVNSEISLANEDNESLKNLMSSKELEESNTKKLYDSRTEEYADRGFFTINLGNDFFDLTPGKGGEKMYEVIDYIYNRIVSTEGGKGVQPVFYIHCNEGKDRTGFIIMLLEALCECGFDDIVNDFMETFFNYYNISIKNDKEKYDTIAELTCYRNLYAFLMPVDKNKGETRINKLASLDLYNFNAKEAVLELVKTGGDNFIKESAINYLAEILSIKQSDPEVIKEMIGKIRLYFFYTPPDK